MKKALLTAALVALMLVSFGQSDAYARAKVLQQDNHMLSHDSKAKIYDLDDPGITRPEMARKTFKVDNNPAMVAPNGMKYYWKLTKIYFDLFTEEPNDVTH